MAPRFTTGSLASRLSGGALLVALLLPALAAAQVPGGDEPFTSVVDSSSYLGQTPLRIWQRTRGFGEETSETMLGTHWATPLSMGLGFIDGNLRIGNSDTDFSVNFGGGFRWRNDDFFTDSPRIFGVSVWYDGEDTQLDNYFNQIGISLERLGPLVDLRLNTNIPLEDVKQGDDVVFTGDTVFSGNNLSQGTLISSDVALRVVDFEIAPRLFNLNAWAYGGGYQMDGEGISELGSKAGVRGYILNDLALDVGVSDDDVFGTNTVVQIIWTPGRVSADPSSWAHTIDDRMREQVFRNPYVAIDQIQTAGAVALTDATGNDIQVVHVDSDAAAGGDGTFENPLNNLDDIDNNSEIGDIVLVHSESTFTGQSAIVQDAQRLLGEGNNQTHTVFTSELGIIDLPESSPGASALAKPIINDAVASAAVILMGGTDEVDTLAEMEVSNLQIDGGARGIFSPTGVGDVNINRMMIANTTGDGIELTPLLETLANNTERLRFTPTIDDVMFDNIGGDDIDLDATTTEPATTPIVETIAISEITSTGGEGVGIRLTETTRAATISDFDWTGGATGDGALRIQNTLSQGTVALSGTNMFTGGQTGDEELGYAIRIEGGAANHTVTGTTINNMGGDAIIANDGTAGLAFTGRIDQTLNNASVLSVRGGHDGNMTFTELTADAGVINATLGDGLQFNDADGVYTFNDNVNIDGAAGAGATAAVNVTGDSTGVITLTSANFDNINGDAITFVGGTANMTLTGRVTQTLNNFAVLDVSGGHDGTLTFNELTAGAGVINATMGDGLQFSNADGGYTFNDAVDLVGTSAGINVTLGSSGTFAFSDAGNDITNPTGIAVNIEDSDSVFTYAGNIDTDATSGRPVRIEGNTGGSITFTSTIDSTDDGILVEGNTGGSVLFSGQVTLDTGTQNGVTIQNNTGGSVRFNALDIETTSGTGFLATTNSGATVDVAGNGNTISTTGGVGLNLTSVTVGAQGVNFSQVDVANATTSGIILSNVTGGNVAIGADGTSNGDGGTITNAAANAIDINNVANVSINRMVINGTAVGVDGIEIDHSNVSQSTVNITNTQIDDGLSGIDYNRSASATSRLVVSNVAIANTAGEGIDIDILGSADANVTINNGTTVMTGDDIALAFNTSGGSNKIVRVLVDGSTFNNSSGTLAAADFQLDGTGTINANVTDNLFDNGGAGRAFIMASNSPATNVRLNLDGNIATAGAANPYLLDENSGDFDVVDLTTIGTRNTGAIEQQGTLDDIPGPVPLPQ